jgi:hypothetical protein
LSKPRRPRALGLLLLGTLASGAVAAMPIEFDPLPLGAEDEPDPPGTASTGTAPDPVDELETVVDVEEWERLADCESGDWVAGGQPEPESARWDYGLAFDHGDSFQGGLNFHPDTWDAFRDADMPAHAGRAHPVEEIEVAERVLEEQGWDAWPVCSEIVGLEE